MGAIFTSPARPFYQSVTLYHLDRLPLDRFTAFCIAHFRKKGKKLDDAVVSRILQSVRWGHLLHAESHERIIQQDGNKWYMC